jgi:hypothetical protein
VTAMTVPSCTAPGVKPGSCTPPTIP